MHFDIYLNFIAVAVRVKNMHQFRVVTSTIAYMAGSRDAIGGIWRSC